MFTSKRKYTITQPGKKTRDGKMGGKSSRDAYHIRNHSFCPIPRGNWPIVVKLKKP